jgi:peroxiredoxin
MSELELLPEILPRTLRLGDPAPGFEGLMGVDGVGYGLSNFAERRLVVLIFSSNRCPTVKAYGGRLRALQARYGPKGVQVVAINSNDSHLYPDETFARMVEFARDSGYNFPYLMDREQSTGRAYGATRTFHVFVLDEERDVRYTGRFDDSRIPDRVTSHDLVNALDDLLRGRAVRNPETRPFGCSLDYVS